MPRTLTPAALDLLDRLPPYFQGDHNVQAYALAVANEQQRLKDAAEELRDKMFPQNADDEYKTLQMWEDALGLPVNPAGATIQERRDKVLTLLSDPSEGSEWVDAITDAVGSGSWSHTEGPATTPLGVLGDYELLIEVPHAAGSYEFSVVEQIARLITPAHLDPIVTDGGGFIIGVSPIGADRL